MTQYRLVLVEPEHIDRSGGCVTIDEDDATVYEPLERILRPVWNGNGDWTETLEIIHTDGTTESVIGHVIRTEEIDDSQ